MCVDRLSAAWDRTFRCVPLFLRTEKIAGQPLNTGREQTVAVTTFHGTTAETQAHGWCIDTTEHGAQLVTKGETGDCSHKHVKMRSQTLHFFTTRAE